MLRDLVTTIQQTGNKEVAAVCIAQHHARPLVRRYQTDGIASLPVSSRWRPPSFHSRRRLRHPRRRTSLHNIRIVGRAATSRSLLTTRTTPTNAVVDVVNRTVETVHRQRVAIAVCDRTCRVDSLQSQYVADRAQTLRAICRNAGSEAVVDREVRSIIDGDKEPAVFHKLLQVLQTTPTESRSHVV